MNKLQKSQIRLSISNMIRLWKTQFTPPVSGVHSAYSKIKSKVKTWPSSTPKKHQKKKKIQGTGRWCRFQSQLHYCPVRGPQPNHCLPRASIYLTLGGKKKKEGSELSSILVQLKNALIPWNIQYQNILLKMDFEDAFSESLLDFLFYNVSKNEK